MDVYEWVVWVLPTEGRPGALLASSEKPEVAMRGILERRLLLKYGEGLTDEDLERLEVVVRPFGNGHR